MQKECKSCKDPELIKFLKLSLIQSESAVPDSSQTRRYFGINCSGSESGFCRDCFDLVLGYNSMEHFDEPGLVVDECLRVLKPGGSMYFWFGPPFNGPFGPHLQHKIGLPYFHHLFPREVVAEYIDTPQKNPYQGKNEWSTEAFWKIFH